MYNLLLADICFQPKTKAKKSLFKLKLFFINSYFLLIFTFINYIKQFKYYYFFSFHKVNLQIHTFISALAKGWINFNKSFLLSRNLTISI